MQKNVIKNKKRLKMLNKNVSPNLFNFLPNAVPIAVGTVLLTLETYRTFQFVASHNFTY